MYCPNCGAQNGEGSRFCKQCGRTLSQATATSLPPTEQPSTYLLPAILVTIFCCQIPGIVSIVYAAQVSGKWSAGDYPGAQAASANARMWMWIGLGLGIIPLGFFIMVAMGSFASSVTGF